MRLLQKIKDIYFKSTIHKIDQEIEFHEIVTEDLNYSQNCSQYLDQNIFENINA